MLLFLSELTERYGQIFRIWLGKDLFVIISDPELVKVALSSNQLLFKSQNLSFLNEWLGQGLLTSGGAAWHRRRKMLTPAFHFKILSAFRQPMEENCNILIEKLKAVAGRDAVNIYPFITLFTLDVICETAMGIKKHAQVNSDSEYVRALQTLCELIQSRIFGFWNRFPLIYKHSNEAKKSKAALDILHGETRRVINLRKELLEKEKYTSPNKTGMLPWLTELKERYGPIFHIWLGKDLFVIISDPELIKAALSSNQLLFKSRNYKIVEPWLGQGLLTSGGEAWHRRRKMLTPAFHFKILSAFQQPMEDNCTILINKLKAAAGQDAINIYPFITLFTLDVICETAMGIKKHAQVNSDSEYVRAVKTLCELLQTRIFSFWERFPIIYKYTEGAKKTKAALDIVHGETMRVINLRRKVLDEQNNSSVEDSDNTFGIKRRLAFLDMLLIAQKEGLAITDIEIREEVDTFMFEGHDTTSSAIAFSVYLLSHNPKVQEKAYQEIIESGDQGKDTLKYLEAVIKESLRLYPSVPSFSRVTTTDFQLGKYTLPEGTTIATFIYMAHRDPNEFENPEKFMPERFLDTAKEHHPYSYVPFSAGPRNCIGQKFAMMELKCTMFNLIKNFEFLPAERKITPTIQLILKSPGGVYVKIKPRNTDQL